MLRNLLEVFIPLFVAIDPFGLVPVYLSLTRGMSEPQRRRTVMEAALVALIISVGFAFLGQAIFDFLGIQSADFKIAGGVILMVLAVTDLLIPGKLGVDETGSPGVVPLAMPLIAGPATLTTTLVLVRLHGHTWTIVGLAVNFAILVLALSTASRIARIVGDNTLRAFSKLVMVLLAAIAVNFIRSGIMEAIGSRP